jgi:hypothetical protein
MPKTARILLVAASAALAACSSNDTIRCTVDDDCLQGGIMGQCLDSPASSEKWCAFSDPHCEGTALRWGRLSGDGLGSECVAGDGVTATLSVKAVGEGAGRITSDPAGIDCPGTCSAEFAVGSNVKLAATADVGSFFEGWGAPCSGNQCVLDLTTATTVQASFSLSGSTRSAAALDHFMPQLVAADGSIVGYQPRTNTVVQVAKMRVGESQPLWMTPVTADGDTADVDGMALLADGDVVVAAGGTTGIGGLPITYPDSALVARLDGATGAAEWVVGFPMEDPYYAGKRLAVDAEGNIYFTGTYRGTTTIGGFQLAASTSSDKNVFVAKLSSAGQFVWVEGLGGNGVDLARGLTSGADGLPVVLLQFSSSTSLGTGNIGGFGGNDCAIAKLAASDGHTLFAQAIGSTTNDDCLLVGASGRSSELAVAVLASGPVKAGSESFAGPGMLILGYSAAGTRNRVFSTTSTALTPTQLTFAADDSYWLTGFYSGTVTLGGAALPDPPDAALGFVAHVSANDQHLFSASIGGVSTTRGDSVDVGERNVTVCGYFSGLATFGNQTLAAGANGSGFVWSLVP